MTDSHNIFVKNVFRPWIVGFALVIAMGLTAETPPLFAGGATRVDLYEKGEVSGGLIRLGDIAEIAGDQSELVEKLRQVTIMKAPSPGESRQIKADSVKSRLRQKGFDLSGILVAGSKPVEIVRRYQEADMDQIEQAVRDFIQDRLLAGTDSARIISIEISKGAKLAEGRLTYDLALPKNSRLKRKVSVHIDLHVNGEWTKKMTAIVKLEIVKNFNSDVVHARGAFGHERRLDQRLVLYGNRGHLKVGAPTLAIRVCRSA